MSNKSIKPCACRPVRECDQKCPNTASLKINRNLNSHDLSKIYKALSKRKPNRKYVIKPKPVELETALQGVGSVVDGKLQLLRTKYKRLVQVGDQTDPISPFTNVMSFNPEFQITQGITDRISGRPGNPNTSNVYINNSVPQSTNIQQDEQVDMQTPIPNAPPIPSAPDAPPIPSAPDAPNIPQNPLLSSLNRDLNRTGKREFIADIYKNRGAQIDKQNSGSSDPLSNLKDNLQPISFLDELKRKTAKRAQLLDNISLNDDLDREKALIDLKAQIGINEDKFVGANRPKPVRELSLTEQLLDELVRKVPKSGATTPPPNTPADQEPKIPIDNPQADNIPIAPPLPSAENPPVDVGDISIVPQLTKTPMASPVDNIPTAPPVGQDDAPQKVMLSPEATQKIKEYNKDVDPVMKSDFQKMVNYKAPAGKNPAPAQLIKLEKKRIIEIVLQGINEQMINYYGKKSFTDALIAHILLSQPNMQKADIYNRISRVYDNLMTDKPNAMEIMAILVGDPGSKEEVGSGKLLKDNDEGITNFDINDIMAPYANLGVFRGTYMMDEFGNAISDGLTDEFGKRIPHFKFGFVINRDKSDKDGSHWIAVIIDPIDTLSVYYVDSYGDPPPKLAIAQIRQIVNKIKPFTMLKLKVNRIQMQSNNSSTCGYFAIRSIIQLLNGRKFKDITGYGQIRKNEADMEDFINKMNGVKPKFELI